MSYFDKEMRLKAFDAAMEIGRGRSTAGIILLEDVLGDARTIAAFLSGDELHDPIPETQADASVTITGAPTPTETMTLTPAEPSATVLPFADPIAEKPARKPRGPNKAKKAKGTRGRPKKVAEGAAEKDLPIANGAGEHVEPPVAEPQQVAA